MRILPLLLGVGLLPALLSAQTEELLKTDLEGRSVRLKLDMPATKDGVDLHVDQIPVLSTQSYSKRLKRSGTALWSGQSALITRLKVKGKHIEFQTVNLQQSNGILGTGIAMYGCARIVIQCLQVNSFANQVVNHMNAI